MTETLETTPAGRIRWEHKGGYDPGHLIGYVGTLKPAAFEIYKPGPGCLWEWALTSHLPGMFLLPADSNHLADLKAEAEKRLEQFAASIGAAFPGDDMKLAAGVLTVELPGLTAVRIDTERRMVAVDALSGVGPVGEPWTVADLRYGTYGGFHRLKPAAECFDAECAGSGEHL